jgi:hypothetical protein
MSVEFISVMSGASWTLSNIYAHVLMREDMSS